MTNIKTKVSKVIQAKTMPDKPDLKYLFEPRSIALIGASHHEDKIGYKILGNIVSSKYPGKIYPINPDGGEILGQKVYKTIDEIKGEIDLVTIVIPAQYVFDAVKSCSNKGVKFLSIITSGFSEIGNSQQEKEIVNYANEHGMRVLGPNIFGIYSARAPVNATFGPPDIKSGSVAILTQSGALGIAMIGKTRVENIGLSSIISIGNKSDIDESDLLEYLVMDDATKVIMMYIEGVKNGERFVRILKQITPKKPVIVIKSGRSKKGATAAASHTGSLAGDDNIFSDIMKQCGVIRAESIQEAIDWSKYLALSNPPKGENSIIITNGGGIGVLATDACEKYNVTLYDDLETMKKIFSDAVPEFGSMKNPIDLTGQAKFEDYQRSLNAAFNDDDIHSVICLGCEAAALDTEKLFTFIEEAISNSKPIKPIVLSFFGGARTEKEIAFYKPRNIPVFSDVYEAVSCLGTLYKNYRNLQYRVDTIDQPASAETKSDTVLIENIINKVRLDKRNFLFSYEGMEIMKMAGIAVPRTGLAHNIEEAIRCAEEIKYPVVMKIVSRDILHKSDAGGVVLHLDNKEEVIDAYQAIIHNCRRYNPYARIEGIEVSEMAASGTETIIGARRDGSFGPIVMFGLGGIYVEVMKDVAFRAFPFSRKEANNMVSQIKSYPLLLGVRGEKRKDIDGIIDVIVKVGEILYEHKDISDIEVNPLITYEEGKGVKAIDARIILTRLNESQFGQAKTEEEK